MKVQFSLFLILALATYFSFSCRSSPLKLVEEKAQTEIGSRDWRIRKEAIKSLFALNEQSYKLSKKTTSVLVNALASEIQFQKTFEEKGRKEGKSVNQIEMEFYDQYLKGGYDTYLEFLTSLITVLKANEGIPLIFYFILQGGYVFNDAILTNFGVPAFDFLAERSSHGSNDERELALSMLSFWINPPKDADHIDPESIPPLTKRQKKQLKLLLLKSFQDPNLEIKYFTIRGLGAFQDDPEIKKELLQLELSGETDEMRSQAKRILQNATE